MRLELTHVGLLVELANHNTTTSAPHKQNVAQGQFLKETLTGLNLEFSFSSTGCYTKVKEPSLPYNLTIAEIKLN